MTAQSRGAASLGMVLAHYGKWVTLEELRERSGASRDGTTLSDLVKTAAAYGLVTTAVPGADLDAEVARVCASLATGAPQGLRESKRILNRDLVARIDAHGEEMAELSARLFASDEAREAMTAFLSRKK